MGGGKLWVGWGEGKTFVARVTTPLGIYRYGLLLKDLRFKFYLL